METENIWKFFHSEIFQILIERPSYRADIIRYFNDKMDQELRTHHPMINLINLYMRSIESTSNGYYFKFNLQYGTRDAAGNFTLIQEIFNEHNNFHISLHQRHPVFQNQSHFRAIRNGVDSKIPIRFRRVSPDPNRNILQVLIPISDTYTFCEALQLNTTDLSSYLNVSLRLGYDIMIEIIESIDIIGKVLSDTFNTMDDLLTGLDGRTIWVHDELEGFGNVARQASELVGGNNRFFNKYMKYKLKYLELKNLKLKNN